MSSGEIREEVNALQKTLAHQKQTEANLEGQLAAARRAEDHTRDAITAMKAELVSSVGEGDVSSDSERTKLEELHEDGDKPRRVPEVECRFQVQMDDTNVLLSGTSRDAKVHCSALPPATSTKSAAATVIAEAVVKDLNSRKFDLWDDSDQGFLHKIKKALKDRECKSVTFH